MFVKFYRGGANGGAKGGATGGPLDKGGPLGGGGDYSSSSYNEFSF